MQSMNMDHLEESLQAVGFHAVILQSLLPVYLHLIFSALFPIFTGAHASLSRPSSAAKPAKKSKKSVEDVDQDDSDHEQKMEGLSPMDAILFPVTAGITLVGLYYLIEYLDDPAILNKIMNWYFALFGTLSLARLLTDTMSNIWSFIFPSTYRQGHEIWKVDSRACKTWATKKTQLGRDSPLPSYLALLPLSPAVIESIWTVKDVPSRKLRIQAYIHKNLKANFRVGVFGLISFFIAVLVELYFNVIAKPWWMTNLLGFSVSYEALQILSPSTAWTGSLILGALFLYDIYFVFFTPIMVTVATSIDIPAKLLFPKPETEDLSMLGLGDIVLPGMVIGFALRFDLFLFYLRKQTIKQQQQHPDRPRRTGRGRKKEPIPAEHEGTTELVKAKYIPATGGWGERFWMLGATLNAAVDQGGNFPKTYFYATISGYVAGLIVTLLVMQVFDHAQPALLYLVPGVLGALWGTALLRGEVQTLWSFTEADGAEDDDKDEKGKSKSGAGTEAVAKSSWRDWFAIGRIFQKREETENALRDVAQNSNSDDTPISVATNGTVEAPGKPGHDDEEEKKGEKVKEAKEIKQRKWDGRLVAFSISLPQPRSTE